MTQTDSVRHEIDPAQLDKALRNAIASLSPQDILPETIREGAMVFRSQDMTAADDSLGLDSLDVIDLALTLERDYGVCVPEDFDMEEIMTYGKLRAFIQTLLDEQLS